MMDGVFHFVLTASLNAAIVGLVIIPAKRVLKNRLSAKWHYLLWMVLVLKLLIPFGPESAVSLFNTMPEMREMPRQGISEIANQMEQRYEASLAAGNSLSSPLPAHQQVKAFKAAALVESLLPYVWAVVMAITLVWLIFTRYSLHSRLRLGSPVRDERILHIFDACKVKIGIHKSINISLVIQDIIGTPSLFGVRSPKILLSPAVLGLSDKELEYILLHELAHYKRKDVPVNYLLLFLQVVHWFNPVIWYCFRRIRQDMEFATDEQVLSILDSNEYKDYGRALLTVLEGNATARFAPRVLGMVDDKKHIERRLNMIRMADYFKGRRRPALVVGLLCMAVLGGLLLTDGLTGRDASAKITGYNAKKLLKYKTAYVGDNSRVVNLISNLPYADLRGKVLLQTESAPYGVTVEYDLSGVDSDIRQIESTFRDNAVIMFALIDNVDLITFNLKGLIQTPEFRYQRAELQKSFERDLREYSKDVNTLETLLKSLALQAICVESSHVNKNLIH